MEAIKGTFINVGRKKIKIKRDLLENIKILFRKNYFKVYLDNVD